jgi:tetratricopeptide (TPR) repeat protein
VLSVRLESLTATSTRCVFELEPQDLNWNSRRRIKKAAKAILDRINNDLVFFVAESKDPAQMLNEGWLIFKAGDTKEALEMYRRFFESLIAEKDITTYFNAATFFASGSEETENFFYVCDVNDKKVVVGLADELLRTARNNLGVFLSSSGDLQTALTIWRLNDENHYSLFNLGEHERKNGRPLEALYYFKRATEGGNASSLLMAYVVNETLPAETRQSISLDPYDDKEKFDAALEYVSSELAVSGDQLYAYARYVLASKFPDRAKPDPKDEAALHAYDPTGVFLKNLGKKDRSALMADVVAAANAGNIYALDALLQDASQRDNLMEVDHWTRRKQELLSANKKVSNQRPSPTATASVLKRVGVTNQAAAAGVVGVMAVAAMQRFTMRQVADNIGNVGDALGFEESGDAFGDFEADADAGGMDFGDFF